MCAVVLNSINVTVIFFLPCTHDVVLYRMCVWLVGEIIRFFYGRPSEDIAPCLGKVALSGAC